MTANALRRKPLTHPVPLCIACIVAALAAAAAIKPQSRPFQPSPVRSFEIFPLETASETSSNASIGDLNGDGHPDVVLVKGRHWQVTTVVFFGDGKGNFTPGPPLPSAAVKSYSGSLADMTKSGHLDIVLSNTLAIRYSASACRKYRPIDAYMRVGFRA